MLFVTRARLAYIAVVAATLLTPATPLLAQSPVAIVEEVDSRAAGVEFMDYLAAGKVIRLGPRERLILGYMRSCWRETITGAVVTVGAELSETRGGSVDRTKVPCDGRMVLGPEQANKSGAATFRAPPKKAGGWASTPPPQLTLYGLAPIVEIKGGGRLVIERLDVPGERIEFDVADGQLVGGAFFDMAKAGKVLTAGALYRASAGRGELVFRVDQEAQTGAPVIARLMRLAPAIGAR